MVSLSRRQVLGGAAALAATGWASGCGGDDAPPTTQATPRYEVGAVFPRGEAYVTAGVENRLPFVLTGADGAPLDEIDGDITFTVSSKGEQVGEPIVAAPRSAGLQRAFVPLRWTPPAAGFYELAPRYAGRDLTPLALQAFPVEGVAIPRIGQPLPVVPTPTTADARGVDPICTAEPPCALHEHDLAASRAAGRAVAVLVSTPAYCQTAICGPVLDLVAAAAEAAGDRLDVIHAEVYANPTAVGSIVEATPAPIVTAFALPFEPCLVVADAAGTVVARLDAIFDADEIADAFALVG